MYNLQNNKSLAETCISAAIHNMFVFLQVLPVAPLPSVCAGNENTNLTITTNLCLFINILGESVFVVCVCVRGELGVILFVPF